MCTLPIPDTQSSRRKPDREGIGERVGFSALILDPRGCQASDVSLHFPVLTMGVTLLDSGCSSPGIDNDKVAFEGLLQYEGKTGVWKERWFVLDSDRLALVKCAASNRRRSRSHGSVLGGDVLIKDAQALSRSLSVSPSAGEGDPMRAPARTDAAAPCSGLEITTQKGARIRFRTKSVDEEESWLSAVSKLSNGFTAGVGERLAERELLAGKYSLVRELGRGASGIVSLYTRQGKPFAIKKIVPQKAKGIPNRRTAPGAGLPQAGVHGTPGSSIPDDVRREIALLKKVSSLPYVIQLHDVILDQERNNYYLVMEYMGGGTIAEWDSERKCYVSSKQSRSVSLLDEATVRRYTTHLVLGVQALHSNRVCHRDIKPENLMASEDRATCKIGDLGVAHYFKEENGVLRDEVDVNEIELWDVDAGTTADATARAGEAQRRKGLVKSTKGTYQFLPPEALSGDAFCGFKADVWSIGVTLYALAFGFLPFYSNDLVKLFEKIESDPLVFPASCQDADLKDLLGAILDKNPETRITLEGILDHRWLHRNVNSKALQSEVRALKRSTSLTVAELDLGSAVSVLQHRFDAVSLALRDDSLCEMQGVGGDASTAVDSKLLSTEMSEQHEYVPRPIAVAADAVLPRWFHRDTELIAAQLHYDWCHSKYLAGWSYGAERDDVARVHPCLMPMHSLPEEEQEKNVRCVVETMRCVVALGCHVTQAKQRQAFHHEPLPTKDVTLSWEMLMLVDLLAENSHEVWAAGYVANGWTHGDSFDAVGKHHPSIKAYMALDEVEKDLSRVAVSSVLKACLCLGYRISCSKRKQFEI